MTDLDAVRERAWVEERRPAVTDADRPMWVAEDPTTDCVGVGRVEAEAVGNLLAVVSEFDDDPASARPLMKLPGRVVTRPSWEGGDGSLLDRVWSFLRGG
ncbi:MAG: hypothetical protein ABEJ61_10525 [Haloferacaceae archaeon]